jgi:DNA-binding CsgD family transcriptional regulator
MTPLKTSHLLELVRLAYAAPASASGWTGFLGRYRTILGGSLVALVHRQRHTGVSTTTTTVGDLAPEVMHDYNAYYGARNPLLGGRNRSFQPGAVTLSQRLLSPEQFLRTEYHNDFALKYGLTCGIGAWLVEPGETTANISCMRPLRAGWFGTDDVRLVATLIPHIQRALQLHQRLEGMRLDQRTEAGVLDRLSAGILIVTGSGRVLVANATARRLLAARDGILVSPDGLRAAGPLETRALRNLIAAAGRSARGDALHSGGRLRLSRPSFRQPLSVLVAPTTPQFAYPALPVGCVTVVVRSPEEDLDADLLKQSYRLTPKEAALAERLLQGWSLESSADSLAITRETARTHLKAILKKSGASRQGEFVRRALTSLPGQVNAIAVPPGIAFRRGRCSTRRSPYRGTVAAAPSE